MTLFLRTRIVRPYDTVKLLSAHLSAHGNRAVEADYGEAPWNLPIFQGNP
jgi:hypothetical protein